MMPSARLCYEEIFEALLHLKILCHIYRYLVQQNTIEIVLCIRLNFNESNREPIEPH